MILYPIGITDSCKSAAAVLQKAGIRITDHPSPDVTHLLLDVPSFDDLGQLRCGGKVHDFLERLPQNITVIGGNLKHPDLEGYNTLDLLKDESYLAGNGAITADCAIRVAGQQIRTTFRDTPVLILGWGRIGKCLADMLRAMGCAVTVAARKETDRAMLKALGFSAVDYPDANQDAGKYPLIFNTVPEMVLTAAVDKSIAIDLASKPGIAGDNVICARGLPGKIAPESAGRLIAETVKRRLTL